MADARDRDLVLAPGTFAYILDNTKGHVNVIVGPNKTSLSATDIPVLWDENHRTYRECDVLKNAIQSFSSAAEGFYIVLTNPSQSEKDPFPKTGTSSLSTDLYMGRKINIPGPISFPLWPCQTAKVIEGHNLHSNQYLIVRIYNDEEANSNIAKAVIKKQIANTTKGDGGEKNEDSGIDSIKEKEKEIDKPNFIMGQLIIVSGTEVAFYIPPTGIEVIPDGNGSYVRDAVTLERLEYCILLDEDGNKRYVQGPAVVFPSPTEQFVEQDGLRKFRAIELNEISGLYIKVIADYEDGGKEYEAGEE